MNSVLNIFIVTAQIAATTAFSAVGSVTTTEIYQVEYDGNLALLDSTDDLMHGAPIRLEVGVAPTTGQSVERLEFYRYGRFVGEGALGANGKWFLETEATAPVFSASDEPSSTLLNFATDNGSFEDWSSGLPVGWYRGHNSSTQALPIQQVTNDAHTGTSCVKVTGVPDYNSSNGNYTMRNWTNVWFYNHIGMVVGNVYKIKFYAKRINGGSDDRLEVGAGYGNTFNGNLKYTRTDGGWELYEFSAIPQEPPLGSAGQLVFTSRKNNTAWLIDSVEVTLNEDSQDIYQVRVVESSGEVYSSEYFGVKTRPFDAKVNFQSQTSELLNGYLADSGSLFQSQESGFSYGWSVDASASLESHVDASKSIREESVSVGEMANWEIAVPDGEYQLTMHLPELSGASRSYSIQAEDQLVVEGAFQEGNELAVVIERVVVSDGRFTLNGSYTSDSNLIAALELTQLSANEGKPVFRRGVSSNSDRYSTVLALDGQPGLRSVDLTLASELVSMPRHYSQGSSDHSIPACAPIVNFGSEHGASALLTDVSYDFGVSTGDIFQDLDGFLLEEVLAGKNPSSSSLLKGFYLVVRDRNDYSVVERIALDLPDPQTQPWNALLEDGMRKKFLHREYGLTTWIKIQSSSEWNYANTAIVANYNYLFTHFANANSVDYTFTVEAASNFNGIPSVQYTEGDYAGKATTNPLYSVAFDVGQPWRVQQFELSHAGELLPSSYQGTDARARSMKESDFESIIYRSLNATGTGAGAVLDLATQAGMDQFEDSYINVDNAPEFKSHPILDQLVADFNSDPLALARFVFNEIEVTDYVGVHPGLTATNVPIEVTLGGLRRDALAVLQEGQGSPREICVLLVYLMRACGVPAAIAEPEGANVYLLDTDFSHLIGQNIAGTALTPEKIPLNYPWVVIYLEGENEPFKHMFPWIKETELTEGYDLYDFIPDRLNSGFKYFDQFIRADNEVMMVGLDGSVEESVRGYDDDQPYVLWPALIKQLLYDDGRGVSFDEIGIRKVNRPQQYAQWQEFPKPFDVQGQPVLYENYVIQPDRYDTIQLSVARDDGNLNTIDLENNLLFETVEIPLMDLHNRSVNLDYSNGKITLSIAPYVPYSGQVSYGGNSYPDIGDVDYVGRAKLGYEYVVNFSGSSAEFAFKEHRQRAYDQTLQEQSTLYSNFTSSRNFWNFQGSFIDSDIASWETRSTRGILKLDHRQILPGNFAFCYNYGRVTPAMLKKHTRDLVYHDQVVTQLGGVEDVTVTRHRLFTLMGQVYWQKIRDFEAQTAQKHKFVLPGKGGALTTGLLSDSSGNLVFPSINVFSLFSNAHYGGHVNLGNGWDRYSSKWDFIHVSHLQGSAYEHAILRNFLGAEGAYSTVKVLQEASRNHRVDPENVPDIVVLTNGPNQNGKDWGQEGQEYYQGKRLKNWASSLWNKVLWHLDASSDDHNGEYAELWGVARDSFEVAYMPPGPVEIDGINRMAVATVVHSGGAGMYISAGDDPINGGAAKKDESLLDKLFGAFGAFIATVEREWNEISVPATVDYGDGNIGVRVFNKETHQYEYQTFDKASIAPSADIIAHTPTEFSAEYRLKLSELTQPNQTIEQTTFNMAVALEYARTVTGITPSYLIDKGWLQYSPTNTVFTNGTGEQVGDPVDVLSGYFYVDTVDLNLPGPFPLEIRRNYLSNNTAGNGFGVGWKFAFMHYLHLQEEAADDEAIIYAAEMDGSVIAYTRVGTEERWAVDMALNPQLKNATNDGVGATANLYNNYILKSGTTYTLHSVNGEIRSYETQSYPLENLSDRERPYIQSWHDAHGNGFTFTYYQDPLDNGYGNIRRMQSTNGNYITIEYNVTEQLSQISTGDGRIVKYEYSPYGDLSKVTLPDRSTINYTYSLILNEQDDYKSTHLLTRIENPLGRILENDYDSERRVTHQRATVGENKALLQNASYVYNHTHQETEGASGHTLVTSINGGVTRYDYDDGQITSIADAENQTIEQEWYTSRLIFPDPLAAPNAQRRIAEDTVATLADQQPGGFPRSLKRLTDKRGKVTYFWYDAFGNIIQTKIIAEIDGDLTNGDEISVVTTDYNSNNLPTSIVDPLGNETRLEYTNIDYPYLPTATESRDANGALISRSESVYSEVETASASAFGLNTELRQAIGTEDESFSSTEYSAHGYPERITRYTDEDDLANANSDPNVVVDYLYDQRGMLVEQQDASGATTQYRYDPMGRPTQVQNFDATGDFLAATYHHYNAAGDLEWLDGPRTGVEDYTYYKYDGAGRLVQQLVWRSQAAVDGSGIEGIPGTHDEAFSVTHFQYDGFGNMTGMIDPNGNERRMTYDLTGRKLTEAAYEGAYGEGQSALISSLLTYEPGGQIQTATNPLGGVTKYAYTDTGALRRQQNPDGTVTQFRYRLDGRLSKEIQPSGNELRYDYDDLARTVTSTLYKDTGELLSATVQYIDRRGNTIKMIDAEDHTHLTTYDDLNRVMTKTGPAGDASGTAQQTSSTSYDPASRTVTITDAQDQTIATTADALGRTVSTIIRDAAGTIARESYQSYAPDHQSVTSTEGTGSDAVQVTTWTNTLGQPVLVQHHLDSGGFDYERLTYDLAGNLTASVDALGYATQRDYDGLNRLDHSTLPDGAITYFEYNEMSQPTHRHMPGGLTHEKVYDNAGRLLSEQITNPVRPEDDGTTPTARRFSYQYYTSGREIGQLQLKTHLDEGFAETYTYDDFLRLDTRTLAGTADLHAVALDYTYDKRGLMTQVNQVIGGGSAGIPSIDVSRSFDAYGQLRQEQVTAGGTVQSSIAQLWDDLGHRTGIRSGVDADLAAVTSLMGNGYQYDFSHTADGRLGTVDYVGTPALPVAVGLPYDATYLTNGRLDSADTYGLRRSHAYDARGRLTARTLTTIADSVTQLNEQIGWTARRKMATYSHARTGQTWDQQKSFTYNPRGQLIDESFLTATATSTQATYDYDADRLGILTRSHLRGSVEQHWDALELSPFARLDAATEQLSTESTGTTTYTANGTADYDLGLQAWHNGQPVPLTVQPTGTGNEANWSAELELSVGQQLLEVQLANPIRRELDVVEKRYFSVASAAVPEVQIQHDPTGRIIRRDYADGAFEAFTWDALGRLWSVERRNTDGTGYDWSAVYDGLGRRISTTYTPLFGGTPQTAQTSVVASVYDPQVEFLELGVKVDAAATQWKVYGNDLNSTYGGLHGMGGLLAIHGADPSAGQQIVDDVFGHQLGTVALGSSVIQWNSHHYTGYGLVGDAPQSIEQGSDLAAAQAWRSYRTDPTGLICMGARYYDATGGRFLSPDPLGHGASMDLYSFADGDPVNFVDPTGRMGQDFGLLNDDPNFVRPPVDSFGDFVDIMTTDFPYAVYRGVTGIPSQVAARGHEIRAEAFDGVESGNLVTGPSTYLAGAAFEMGGFGYHLLLNAPENAVDIAVHGLNRSGLNGETNANNAELVNAMIGEETSFFFGDVVPYYLSNPGQTLYSMASGDPMPVSAYLDVSSGSFNLNLSGSGSSQFLTDTATTASFGLANTGYSVSSRLSGGTPSPYSTAYSGLSLLNLGAGLVNGNSGLLGDLANHGIQLSLTDQGISMNYQQTFGNTHVQGNANVILDPVHGNNPKR